MAEDNTRLTKSAEDYLEVIGHLCRKDGHAQVSDIATLLNVKKPSVTAAMRKLCKQGYIAYQAYYPITLTEKGKQYADLVTNAHGILMQFLITNAGLTQKRAEEVACQMEHILTFEETSAIADRLKRA